MAISEKLALEIYAIEAFHLFAVVLILGFTAYLYFKTEKSFLFWTFASIIGMLTLWMVAKMLKTVSPNATLRWSFIVLQYVGVQFSGYSVVLFAYALSKGHMMRIKKALILAIPPFLSLLVVATNPLHMMFYSYYDFYKDDFGVLFFPVQVSQYIYLFVGIIMLSKRFTYQAHFRNRQITGRLFAFIVLIPILCNVYYLLVKLTDVPFILPFPFFDFTPITSAIALILFILPALRYRFLDLIPMAYRQIYEHHPDAIMFAYKDRIFDANQCMSLWFPWADLPITWSDFAKQAIMPGQVPMDLSEMTVKSLRCCDGKVVDLNITNIKSSQYRICLTDVSQHVQLTENIRNRQDILEETNHKLQLLAETTRELAIIRARKHVAQDVHDILGHSLTVVIGLSDLAVMENNLEMRCKRLHDIRLLLLSSIADLECALNGDAAPSQQTTLIKGIQALENDNLILDLNVQGVPYELKTDQTEALFRTCREAMTNAIKHGQAKTIFITLRFQSDQVELYLINDGNGCNHIRKSYGLSGIEERITALGGFITFGSDGEKGFHIHLTIPRNIT